MRDLPLRFRYLCRKHFWLRMKEKLAATIRHYNLKGWSPATSTNYSFKDLNNQIWVSRSGVDKSEFESTDFITIDVQGKAIGEYATVKPSAETLIHTEIYRLFPKTKVILHSHSVYPILLTENQLSSVAFKGYEVQKGFEGIETHDMTVNIPIFANSQNMEEFVRMLQSRKQELINHCFMIRLHGTYAWGTNLFEAKRHLETLEYLCKCEFLKRK